MTKKHLTLTFALLFIVALGAGAQTSFGNVPETVNASDATITKMGHMTMTMGKEAVVDPKTQETDSVVTVRNVDWGTESGTARKRMARRRAGSYFENQDDDWWLDMWWFTYEYPSVNADGEPVTLSALACMPDEDCSHINNVIIGCHVTITSNKECPSRYSEEGSALSDVSLLMNHAGSGLVVHSSQGDMPYYNLVILPDYEGYGVTRNHAHPYLYQELTARQVVDATRYGIALYKSDNAVEDIRHSFRSGWRTICLGYSQGGSVALATQRFIEQNGLTDELQLKDAHKSGDITAIDSAINNLNQVMQAASQKMYAQAGAGQPGGAGFGSQDPNAGAGFQGGQQTQGHNPQDDIQDADFEEVK